MAKTIFISHANQDKSRIYAIVEALLNEGFSLFIDHPEEIENIDIDLVDGQTIRSLWDIRCGRTTGYQDDLDAELRSADCVLGILSDSISEENSVLLGEFDIARYEGKLILCSIAKSDYKLPSRLASYNANPFDLERHGETIVAKSLRLLTRQVRNLIESRERNAGTTPPVRTVSSAFRVLHDLAPLRMGRSNQVDLLTMLIDDSADPAKPALLLGPRNELPYRLPECLGQNSAIAAAADLGTTVAVPVEWPANTGANFERLFQRRLSKQISGVREDMSCAEIATAIANKGHRHIVYSNVAFADGKYRRGDVEAWARFWQTRWPVESRSATTSAQAPKIMPLLNLVLKDAEAGWDEADPRLPPCGSGADETKLRTTHAALLDEVMTALAIGDGGPVLVNPVRASEFEDWITALDDRILGDRDRAGLRRGGNAIFGDPPKEEGVPLQLLYNFASDWLKNVAA